MDHSKEIALTVVSYGGGQDTTYFVHRLCVDPAFRAKHIAGKLLIVGSDTGDEHPHTYQNIERVKKLCALHNIEFHWLTNDMGYHREAWKTLTHQYIKNSSCGSAAYQQTCTDNLKVKVVDRFVESWIKSRYGYTGTKKRAFYQFYTSQGPIRLILGFAAAEEGRTSAGNKFDAKWKRDTVQRYYPLIIDGTSRQDCINYLEAADWTVFPSNCMRCFYQSLPEILWLYRNYPAKFNEWVAIEKAKIDKYAASGFEGKNFGVYGKKTLSEKLVQAIEQFGHLTDDELNEYKYSHGHCIKSKY